MITNMAKSKSLDVVADRPVDYKTQLEEAVQQRNVIKAILQDLQQQRLSVEKTCHDLAEQRRSLSYLAHSGDDAARVELSRINQASLTATLDAENVASALQECERRLSQAELEHTQALDRLRAHETLSQVNDLIQVGVDLDCHLKQFLSAFDKFEAVVIKINSVAGLPGRDILFALSRRALATHLMARKNVFELEHLAPAARTSFSDISAAWARAVSEYCQRKLNKADGPEIPDKSQP
jgi:hypothetical protein